MTARDRGLFLLFAGSVIGAGAIALHLRGRTASAVHAPARPAEPVRRVVALASPGEPAAASDPQQAAQRTPVEPDDTGIWSCPVDLTPFDEAGGRYVHALVPVVVGDRALVSTTMRVVCVDVATGELLWEQGPPEGWRRLSVKERGRLFHGLEFVQQVVFPAAGGDTVVAALQLPFSGLPIDDRWQGIVISCNFPQRRLFAFDLETGRELWSHSVNLEWADERWRWDRRGDFAQRMRVAGPPVVVDQRVLVPCYGAEGRITYHVACYGLRTGRPLWTTYVGNGRRPTNVWGNITREFAAPPLVVAGSRVVAQTDLGTVAALDLATGDILWKSDYRSRPFPKTRSYNPPPWPITWRVAPPAVVGDVVVSAPADADRLMAFHLADGRLLWEVEEQGLRSEGPHPRRFDLLLGADPETVYLAGTKIAGLGKPRGVASPAPFVPRWTVFLENDAGDVARSARALLWRDRLVLPGSFRHRILDRASGEELDVPFEGREGRGRLPYGNLGVGGEGGEAMVALNREGLHGFVR